MSTIEFDMTTAVADDKGNAHFKFSNTTDALLFALHFSDHVYAS